MSKQEKGSASNANEITFVIKYMKDAPIFKVYAPSDSFVKEQDSILPAAKVPPEKLINGLYERDKHALINRSGFYAKNVPWYDNAKQVGKTWVIPVAKIKEWMAEGNSLEWGEYRGRPQLKKAGWSRSSKSGNETPALSLDAFI